MVESLATVKQAFHMSSFVTDQADYQMPLTVVFFVLFCSLSTPEVSNKDL